MNTKQYVMQLTQKIIKVVLGDLSRSACANLEMFYIKLVKKFLRDYPENLIKYGFSVYSQNEEDGIIQEIFNRIAVKNIKFIEFGVQAAENNTLNAVMNGGRGTWVDKGLSKFKQELQQNKKLNIIDEFVTMENIFEIYLSSLNFLELKDHETIDLLSLDLDGNDYYFISQLLSKGASPKLFCLEYNPKFHPPTKSKIEYNHYQRWEDNNDYYGCSLQEYVDLFKEFDYTLLVCNITGSNCFFIKNDYTSHFEIYSHSELYQPGRDYLSPFFKGKKPSMRYLLNLINSKKAN